MAERKTIYGICSGCYSDWTVSLLCESREQAEAAVAEMGGDYEIEEFDYHPSDAELGVHTIYEAKGLEGSMDVRVQDWKQFGPAPARPEVREAPWHGRRAEHPIFVEARCRDRNAAIKAVKDRLAALKAQGDWLPLSEQNAATLGVRA